jgi:hypothetical protein
MGAWGEADKSRRVTIKEEVRRKRDPSSRGTARDANCAITMLLRRDSLIWNLVNNNTHPPPCFFISVHSTRFRENQKTET